MSETETVVRRNLEAFSNHPGFGAAACNHRHTVTKRDGYGRMTSCGFGCLATGGHCLPGTTRHCPEEPTP